jgi:hypothetical protein
MGRDNDVIMREPPAAGSEVDTLIGSLERQRRTFAWKCGNLDAVGLRATLGPSTMTLGGLLKHLAAIEDYYFSVKLHGRGQHPPFDAAPWDDDADWEWHSAAGDSPAELMSLWQETVARSRVLLTEAIADGGLDRLSGLTGRDGPTPSLRRLLIDLIEEYARHTGHADLIRESVDGLAGEDPPE